MTTRIKEETLDPKDWKAMRALGHQMVNDMMTYLETVRERPVWQPIPEKVRENLKKPLPMKSQGAKRTYKDFLDSGNGHGIYL